MKCRTPAYVLSGAEKLEGEMASRYLLRAGAALLAMLTAGVHIVAGGMDSLVPMLNAGLDPVAEGAIHASWHIVSAFLLWSAPVFWKGGETARHFASLWIVLAAIFVAVDLWQSGPGGLVQNPQWLVLGPTGLLAWFAARPSTPDLGKA
jgi:hypothetical protein